MQRSVRDVLMYKTKNSISAAISTGVISTAFDIPQFVWGFTTANALADPVRFATVTVMTPNYFT